MGMTPLLHLYAFHVHIGFSVLFFFGVFLLFHWAKTQSPEFQKKFALAAMGIGIATVLVTVPFCLAGMALLHSLAMPVTS